MALTIHFCCAPAAYPPGTRFSYVPASKVRRNAMLDVAKLRPFAALPPGMRRSHFAKAEDSERNEHPVFHTPPVPEISAGFALPRLFAKLGEARPLQPGRYDIQFNPDGSVKRKEVSSEVLVELLANPEEHPFAMAELRHRAEQEYRTAFIDKGALADGLKQARQTGRGLAVRPTSAASHMGIESGDPTKPQELKNKTASELDAFLDPRVKLQDVGKVVHYDPRLGVRVGRFAAWRGKVFRVSPEDQRWNAKLASVGPAQRRVLGHLVDEALRAQGHKNPAAASLAVRRAAKAQVLAEAKAQFLARCKEFEVENEKYEKGGTYATEVFVHGVFLRLHARPDKDIVGDHDLYAITDKNGKVVCANPRPTAGQKADPAALELIKGLCASPNFQAQHGTVLDWCPTDEFNVDIKDKIVGNHKAGAAKPLIHCKPDGKAALGFHVPGPGGGHIESAWNSTNWLTATPTGRVLKAYLDRQPGMAR